MCDAEHPNSCAEKWLPDISPAMNSCLGDQKQGLENVVWNPDDHDHPDYGHLTQFHSGDNYKIRAEDIETLIRCNAFAIIDQPLLIFALRGAAIAEAEKREGVDEITVTDQRPDHRHYRCVIGVLNRETKRIWAYKASTVPNAEAVLAGYSMAQRGEFEGNLLATGCYTYTVGTHRAGTEHEISGALRLSTTPEGASAVVALRTINDVVYDRKDFWHQCTPADNIHPGGSLQHFSSLGCLTLPGDYNKPSRTHTGLWADFRVALGMGVKSADEDTGRQYSVILLTGKDAALASRLRTSGEIRSPKIVATTLARLRFGSKGAAVAKLQEKLGVETDPSQYFGVATSAALIARQQELLDWADAIYSLEMDAQLGLGLFTSAASFIRNLGGE